MHQELIDDELWSPIEPLLPNRASQNRRYAGRKPTPDRAEPVQCRAVPCSAASYSCCARASPGISCRIRWAAVQALRAGGGWLHGKRRASGNAYARRCCRSYAVAATRHGTRHCRQFFGSRNAGGNKGSSWITEKRGADLEEEVFLVVVPVSPTLDDLDGVVDAFDDAGIKRMSAAGHDSVPVTLRALRKQLQRGNSALPSLLDPLFPGLFRSGRLAVDPPSHHGDRIFSFIRIL